MIYESECRFCGTETEWAEPHMYHLPQNHPKRQWANISVCRECHDAYGPPLLFDEWDAVRFEWGSCPFCGSRNIRWVGTANWANPWKLLQQCLELINESAEGINFPTELREQFARLTTVCYECTPSTPEKALYQKLKQRIKKVTLEEPMWEPVELDEIKITLDTNEDREITDIDSE